MGAGFALLAVPLETTSSAASAEAWQDRMPPNEHIRLVVPCYNPASGWVDRLAQRVGELRAALPGIAVTVTLVNDGSLSGITPGDRARLGEALHGVHWIDHPGNRGKGAALRTGVAAAPPGPCLITDVDLPYTVGSMREACAQLLAGSDVVLGHRRPDYYARVPWARRVISRTFRWVLRNIMRFPISDTQCGLKGFGDRGRALFMATTIDRFLFDMEFVMLVARERGLKVGVIDAQLSEGVRFSRMNYRILLRESANFLSVALRSLLRH